MTRRFSLRQLISALLLSSLGFLISASAQESPKGATDERDRGIQLYQKGDSEAASQALRAAVKRHKEDVTAWYYLGRTMEQKGDNASARKAYEQAAKMGERALEKHINQASTSQEVSSALLSIRSELVEAAESAEKCIELNPNLSRSKREEWMARADMFREFVGLARPDGLKLYSSKEVTTKARVLRKDEPTYTEEARKNQIQGRVVLRCVFAANGKVILIRAVRTLPDGLTENAIRSARAIRFIPATKDGKPVSMWMELQYEFHLF